ncbi:MAG: glycosyl hydrolase family 8 [Acidobacteriaceae bacterium]|nr:glycosyl hydrolase family 8 [Acidobacteriaceae bacterium]
MEAGYPQGEIDKRIAASFAQLFHGDPKRQTVYFESGRNANGALAYIEDIVHQDVRTEGMSYGMMIAVQTGHKQEFDALWNWAVTHMLITDPKNPHRGYFAWSMNADGTARSSGPATDGEEYFVMSLYFAAHRWGNGQGIYNYQSFADVILREMRHHAVSSATGPFRIHPGDALLEVNKATYASSGPMVDEQTGMICFVPASSGCFTDPSYQLPAFYELWALWGPKEDRVFWKNAAASSRKFFVKAANPSTGLSSDYANFDGTPHPVAWNPMAGNFSFDSWRTVANWSIDQVWWESNPDAKQLSSRIQQFFVSQGVKSFSVEYTLAGKPLSRNHSTGLVATTAAAGLATDLTPTSKAFIEEFWNSAVPDGGGRYYDGLLYMLSLLQVSGQYRIWMPNSH